MIQYIRDIADSNDMTFVGDTSLTGARLDSKSVLQSHIPTKIPLRQSSIRPPGFHQDKDPNDNNNNNDWSSFMNTPSEMRKSVSGESSMKSLQYTNTENHNRFKKHPKKSLGGVVRSTMMMPPVKTKIMPVINKPACGLYGITNSNESDIPSGYQQTSGIGRSRSVSDHPNQFQQILNRSKNNNGIRKQNSFPRPISVGRGRSSNINDSDFTARLGQVELNNEKLYEKLKAKEKHQEETIEQFNNQLSSLQNEKEQLTTQTRALQSSIYDIEQTINEFQNHLEELQRSTNKKTDTLIRSYKLKCQEKEWTLNNEYEKLLKEQEDELSSLEKYWDVSNTDNTELAIFKQEQDSLNQKISELQDQFQRTRLSNEQEITSQRETLTKQFELYRDERERSLEILKNLKNNKQNQLQSIQNDVSNTSDQLIHLEQSSLDIQKRIDEKENLSTTLKSSTGSLKDNIYQLDTKIEERQKKIDKLSIDVKNASDDFNIYFNKLQKEINLRRKLSNTILELKGNMRCFINILSTPGVSLPIELLDTMINSDGLDGSTITINKSEQFIFDKVFDIDTSIEDRFGEIGYLLEDGLSGYYISFINCGYLFPVNEFTETINMTISRLISVSQVLKQKKQWLLEFDYQFVAIDDVNNIVKDISDGSSASISPRDHSLVISSNKMVDFKSVIDSFDRAITFSTSSLLFAINISGTNTTRGTSLNSTIYLLNCFGEKAWNHDIINSPNVTEMSTLNVRYLFLLLINSYTFLLTFHLAST